MLQTVSLNRRRPNLRDLHGSLNTVPLKLDFYTLCFNSVCSWTDYSKYVLKGSLIGALSPSTCYSSTSHWRCHEDCSLDTLAEQVTLRMILNFVTHDLWFLLFIWKLTGKPIIDLWNSLWGTLSTADTCSSDTLVMTREAHDHDTSIMYNKAGASRQMLPIWMPVWLTDSSRQRSILLSVLFKIANKWSVVSGPITGRRWYKYASTHQERIDTKFTTLLCVAWPALSS